MSPKLAPPVPAVAFISRVASVPFVPVPIAPVMVVVPAPVRILTSLSPPLMESSFPVIFTFPPPPVDESISSSARSTSTSPVISKTPLFARVISPPKLVSPERVQKTKN